MSYKLISALSKSNFAINEEAINAHFPIAQAILRGEHALTAEELPDDEFEPLTDEPADDEFTGRIAVMHVTGVLLHYGGLCSWGTADFAYRLNEYAADTSIAGVIVLADTPGGQVSGIEVLREAVQNVKKQKPIITLVNDGMLCSGGVWGFIGSSEVYAATELCDIGSIGVMARLLDMRKAMEKEGYREVVIRAPQSKDKAKDVQDALDGNTAAIDAELEFICNRFFAVVGGDREGKLTSEEWKTGKTYFSADAQRIGLIDGILNYEGTIARMHQLIADNQNNNNNMFGNKLPKVTALAAAGTITAAHLEAANTELVAQGINGVTLCLDSELEAHANNAATIDTLNTQISDKDATITTLNTQIADKETQIANLQAKLDGKPAEDVTNPTAGEENIPDTQPDLGYTPTSVDLEKQRQANQWK